jgi:hypothetical protein
MGAWKVYQMGLGPPRECRWEAAQSSPSVPWGEARQWAQLLSLCPVTQTSLSVTFFLLPSPGG